MWKYTYIGIYAIIIGVALFHVKKYKHNIQLKLWLYFLIYSFITEVLATYFIYVVGKRANIIYNSWWLVNSIFYIIFFLNRVISKIKRKFIISYLSAFILYNFISILFFKNYRNDILSESFIIGQFFVVLSIMIYYAELLSSDMILRFQKSLFFWISLGALVFNIGLLPVFVIAELIEWQGVFRYIIFGLNVIMAGCFITGFIVSKKEFNN